VEASKFSCKTCHKTCPTARDPGDGSVVAAQTTQAMQRLQRTSCAQTIQTTATTQSMQTLATTPSTPSAPSTPSTPSTPVLLLLKRSKLLEHFGSIVYLPMISNFHVFVFF
jgi:hypothetical protein